MNENDELEMRAEKLFDDLNNVLINSKMSTAQCTTVLLMVLKSGVPVEAYPKTLKVINNYFSEDFR